MHFEQALIEHGALTLAGLKPASLFRFLPRDGKAFIARFLECREELAKRGLRLVILKGCRKTGSYLLCLYRERELTALSQRELCQVRGRDIALVAQNPATSLNPSLRVGRQIEEVFRLRGENRIQRRAHTLELLRSMAFSDPERVARSYPFELSGGMCQRALTAIAVAARPRWLIADEPTKGLDAVVRNQVYDTFRTVREQYRAGFLVITHDLLLARKFCDRIVVMYCGRVLETNTARELFEHPRHPYTQGLIASLPHLGMRPMAGFSPAFTHQPAGCVFHPRCPHAQERCRLEEPGELCLGEGRVACHGCT